MSTRPFSTLKAVAAPLDLTHVDTDQIIPGRFLVQPRSAGLGQFAFRDLRLDADGGERAEFPLNRGAYRDAQILVTGDNFGCGSSRESAVWALVDYGAGIRAIIAPRFGDIFYNNCCKNGLLPIRLDGDVVADMRRTLRERPGAEIAVDLPAQTVIGPDGAQHPFEIDSFHKHCLVHGLDDIDLILQHEAAIAAFETERRQAAPWSVPVAASGDDGT